MNYIYFIVNLYIYSIHWLLSQWHEETQFLHYFTCYYVQTYQITVKIQNFHKKNEKIGKFWSEK